MKIKLFVVAHKEVSLPDTPCLVPIRSDRTDGENIAAKEDYCELRAQYWVWKNDSSDTDYVGFFHYRRYLEFDPARLVIPPVTKRPVPYQIRKWPDPTRYEQLKIEPLISRFDVIAPIWEYTGLSVLYRYGMAKDQRKEDLELVRQILSEKYPEFLDAANQYLNGQGEYYCNMFVMRRSIFEKYCEWLFDILGEIDRRVQNPMPRTNGYLGERLFGIYFIWLQKNARCGELMRLHFPCYDDQTHHFAQERIINFFVPPGGFLRGTIRKIARYARGH